jgi:hypothetical protein
MKSVVPPAPPKQTASNQVKGKRRRAVSVVSWLKTEQNVRSRDLVLFQEKAPSVTAPAQPVAAPVVQSTIVVNTSDTSNNAVYTEIKLKHD